MMRSKNMILDIKNLHFDSSKTNEKKKDLVVTHICFHLEMISWFFANGISETNRYMPSVYRS